MYPSSLDLQARQERYKDLLREADRERLIRVAGLQPPSLWQIMVKVTRQVGRLTLTWRFNKHPVGPVATTCSGRPCC